MRCLSRRILPAGLVLATAVSAIGLSVPAAGAAPVTAPVAPAPQAAAAPPRTAAPAANATPGNLNTIPLTGASSGARRTASFSLVGVSWDRSSGPNATFEVRTRTGNRWTAWSTLTGTDFAAEGGRADDRTRRAATDPLYTGASDGVEVRRSAGSPRVTGAQIELVDPGVSAADAALPAPAPDGARSQTGPSATATRPAGVPPTIISRAGWGADERLRSYNAGCSSPGYGTTVKMGVVHHTAGTNNYTSAQSASIIRGIFAYHVKSNRWCDVGYNFLVDRFGRIFEGRAGGTNLPVIGAHTGGFNTDSFGASIMGDFTSVAPPAAAMNALADLFAWKLSSFYRNPNGKTVMRAGAYNGSRFPAGANVTLNTISGHRDMGYTTCPGNRAYALLPSLRSMVTSRMPASPIGARWNLAGGARSTLGEPTSGERATAGGLMTQFQNGSLSYSASTGTRLLSPPFTATFLKAGGPGGFLGFPTARDEAPTVDGIGRSARFQRGFIHSSPASGTHETHGAIADRYAALNFEWGVLGYPQTDVTTRPDGVGRYNRFAGGYIFYTPTLGAHDVSGVMVARYRALNFEAGVLGYPRVNPGSTADGAGRYQHFVNGSLFWSPTTGTHEVRGKIKDRYATLGWERGALGYPTTDERTVAPGVVQTDFQHGSISWVLATGATTVTMTPVVPPTTEPTTEPTTTPTTPVETPTTTEPEPLPTTAPPNPEPTDPLVP